MPCFLIVLGVLIAFDVVVIPGLALVKGTALVKVSAIRDGKALEASIRITEWEGQLLGTGVTPCEFTVAATGTGYTSYFVICTWEGNTEKRGIGVLDGSILPVTFDFTEEAPPTGPERYALEIYCGTLMITNPATGRHYYDEGTSVSVRAIPNEGCQFDFWYVHNPSNQKTYTESANPLTLKMDHAWMVTGHASAIPVPPEEPPIIPGEDGNGEPEAEADWREYLNEVAGSIVSTLGFIWLVLAARKGF